MIHKLCNRRDLPAEGTLRALSGLGLDLCLATSNGQPFAVGNRCPHQGAPLSAGSLEHGSVVCPVHAWRFRLADGAPDPPHSTTPSLPTYELRILGDEVFIRIPG